MLRQFGWAENFTATLLIDAQKLDRILAKVGQRFVPANPDLPLLLRRLAVLCRSALA
jgi:hypothetical protein